MRLLLLFVLGVSNRRNLPLVKTNIADHAIERIVDRSLPQS
jgi:hypothetical protein